jgi:uncharacterized protein
MGPSTLPPIVRRTDDGSVDDRLVDLSRAECLTLLHRNPIGRVAILTDGVPEVFPVNFVVSGDAVVFRTALGSKLLKGVRTGPIAFEVDDYRTMDHSGWSVLVTGSAEEVDDLSDAELAALRLLPWAGDARRTVVRLRIDEIHGRRLGELPPRRSP